MEELNFTGGIPPEPQAPQSPQASQPDVHQVPTRSRLRKLLLIAASVIGILVVILFAGVYLVYGQGKTKIGQDFQDKIWNTLLDSQANLPIESQTSLTYQDKGTFHFVPSEIIKAYDSTASANPKDLKTYDDQYSFTLSNMKVGMTVGGYVNRTDSTKPKIDITSSGVFDNNGIEYSADYAYKQQGKDAFTKYDYNQAVAESVLYKAIHGFSGDLGQDQNKGVWLKTAADLNNYADTVSAVDPNFKNILKDNRPFEISSFKGLASINGHMTWHYGLALDKPKLRNIIEQILDSSGSSLTDNYKSTYMQVVDDELSKLNVQDFEIWVGASDHKVYKATYKSNALSVTQAFDTLYKSFTTGDGKKLIQDSLGGASAKSRDAKRLADVRQLATALELYYNDNNGYPAADKGVPVGLAPSYVGQMPTAPTPADGNCNDFYNTYWYKTIGTPTQTTDTHGNKIQTYQQYALTFCLGGITGSFAPGVLVASPTGIAQDAANTAKLPNKPADSTPALASDQQIQSYILDLYKTMPYDAELSIDMEVLSSGVDKDVQLPTNFKDMTSQAQSGLEPSTSNGADFHYTVTQ